MGGQRPFINFIKKKGVSLMISSSVHLQFIVRPSHSEKKREIPPNCVPLRTNSPRFSNMADKFPPDKFPQVQCRSRQIPPGQIPGPGFCVGAIRPSGNLSAETL